MECDFFFRDTNSDKVYLDMSITYDALGFFVHTNLRLFDFIQGQIQTKEHQSSTVTMCIPEMPSRITERFTPHTSKLVHQIKPLVILHMIIGLVKYAGFPLGLHMGLIRLRESKR